MLEQPEHSVYANSEWVRCQKTNDNARYGFEEKAVKTWTYENTWFYENKLVHMVNSQSDF